MSLRQVSELHPLGWQHDPEEEKFRLSIIDITPNCAYNHMAVFFRMEDAIKEDAVTILKAGLERTLSQARHLCGTIEPDDDGGFSIVRKKGSTVRFVVHQLDPLDDNHPSLDDMEKAYFSGQSMKDANLWGIPELTWGEKPVANPNSSPAIVAYQINLTRGGLVFSMHCHHYASDLMGWKNVTSQLADNCFAIKNSTTFPSWDPACIDASRFVRSVPKDSLIEGPPILPRHPDHPEQQAVLFHLPKSKARELKKLAAPLDSTSQWISTHDAVCAYIWRTLSKLRAPFYQADPSAKLWWAGAVNMRPRLRNPPVPERMLRNVIAVASSDNVAIPPLSVKQVVSEASLSDLAVYLRKLNNNCTEEHLERLIDVIAPIRDKRSVSLRADAHPPMSMFVTDTRAADAKDFDFGFAKPVAVRHLWGNEVAAGVILIYAPFPSGPTEDEGWMFTIGMEKELVPNLIANPEWTRYFEYRGID